MNTDVLVIGGGIAGMQAALLLAEKDHHVHVLERSPAIGGFFPLLDRQFPTNSCGVCFMNPSPQAFCPIYESHFHEHIDLLTNCEMTDLKGSAGDFEATYVRHPRFVDTDKCTLCGKCTEVCPVEAASEFGAGVEKRKAIYLPFAQAIPRCYAIDQAVCTRCGECVKVCEPGAIDLEEAPCEEKVTFGAAILAFGFEPFHGENKGEFGLGRYENVMSSIQYERMLSFSSPTCGIPRRPSDGEIPRRIAFLQCVGSRDISVGRGYCSSVCCMYAIKQCLVSKERSDDLDAALFYMDLRTVGKDYERYMIRARDEVGVRFVRGGVSSVRELQRTNNLVIEYGLESGDFRTEEFDMVVLAVGLTPPESVKAIARKMGIALNEFGFCETREFATTQTEVPGIFVAGAIREPRDIPETVVEACSATADVSRLLGRYGPKAEPANPQAAAEFLRDYVPRTGVFICDYGGRLTQRLDVDAIIRETGKEQSVACVRLIDVASLARGHEAIEETIRRQGLNRVVVAGYRGFELVRAFHTSDVFGGAAGAFEHVNIGEQCADVHGVGSPLANDKAIALVVASVRKARLATPMARAKRPADGRVLVVGGGVAGMSSALALADQGINVVLVEKSAVLGGNALHAHRTVRGSDIQKLLRDLVSQVNANPGIEVLTEAEVKGMEGKWGNFTSTVAVDGEQRAVSHGAVIVATGAREAVPEDYLFGKHPDVITQRTFEKMLAAKDLKATEAESVVMIQCAGSRDDRRPYCSRICCEHALKNALALKDVKPDAQVYVLFRDMRTYGFYEKYYQEVRSKGVVFVRWDPPSRPQVSIEEGSLCVSFFDGTAGGERRVTSDLVVLSNGVEADEATERLAEVLGLQLNRDGFFAEANPKSAPLDSVDRGKYFCGLCHSPIHIDTAIIQGKAAAARAATLLWRGVAEDVENLSQVNASLCAGCGACVAVCRYSAIALDPEQGIAQVDPALCRGCGVCAATCRMGAIDVCGFSNEQLLAALTAL